MNKAGGDSVAFERSRRCHNGSTRRQRQMCIRDRPKGKVSKARRDKRRSSHWKLAAPGLVKCPKCGALHLPHRMCQECGTYNGREVKVVKSVVAK